MQTSSRPPSLSSPVALSREDIVLQIRKVLSELHIEIVHLVLFGSQARGDATPQSDWDFVLVTPEVLPRSTKKIVWQQVSRQLARSGCAIDLMIKSLPEYESDRKDKGKVTYYALREGVRI